MALQPIANDVVEREEAFTGMNKKSVTVAIFFSGPKAPQLLPQGPIADAVWIGGGG